MTSPAHAVADALGVLLQRNFRAQLYNVLVDGVHEAVDAAAYPVISGVARLQPLTAAALGAAIGLDRSVVSRRANRLAGAGLVHQHADDTDLRATLLSLSPAGEAVIETLRSRLVHAVEDHLSSWSPQERRQFAELLTRFVEPGSL